MAGELVDLKIKAYAAKHNMSYTQAFAAVMTDVDCDEDVLAYARREPGHAERMRDLERAQSKLAGLVNQRAKAIQRRSGELD
jgi:hypothetical protein